MALHPACVLTAARPAKGTVALNQADGVCQLLLTLSIGHRGKPKGKPPPCSQRVNKQALKGLPGLLKG